MKRTNKLLFAATISLNRHSCFSTQKLFSDCPTHVFKETRVSLKIRVGLLLSGTFFQTLNLAVFSAFLTGHVECLNSVWATQVFHTERPLLFTTRWLVVTQSAAWFVCGRELRLVDCWNDSMARMTVERAVVIVRFCHSLHLSTDSIRTLPMDLRNIGNGYDSEPRIQQSNKSWDWSKSEPNPASDPGVLKRMILISRHCAFYNIR